MSKKKEGIPDTELLYSDKVIEEQHSSPIYEEEVTANLKSDNVPQNKSKTKLLGILSIVLNLICPIAALIVGMIGLMKAEEDEKTPKTLCMIGIICSFIVFGTEIIALFLVLNKF